jgi:long-subunit fatty acid transport protein
MDYSQLEFKDPEGLSSSYISDANKEIKDILRSAVNYNVGLEYNVPMVGLKLRGGYLMQQSPFEGDDSDFNHQYVTGGIGFLANGNIGLDLAYAYGWWNDIGDNYGSNVSRTFQEINTHNLILTTTFRF